MMPGESGLELARDLKAISNIPICMLTARAEPEQRIEGLEAGVDDYVAKPFEPRELLLRLQNILRRGHGPVRARATRSRWATSPSTSAAASSSAARRAIKLTERERDLLRMFAQRPGMPIARHELASDDSTGSERAIDVQINRLRRKIETDPANPVYLQTVRGKGYILTPTEAPTRREVRTRAAMLARSRRWLARSWRTAPRRAALAGAWPAASRARAHAVGELAPKGLYARALIIIIAPIVLLESVVAFAFMERHWNQVTRRLSEGMARDIAAVVDIYEASASKRRHRPARRDRARTGSACRWRSCRPATCRTPQPKPFFDLLDRALSDEIRANVKQPVLDRHGRPVAARRDPRQARQGDPALRGPARPGLRLQLAHLPDVDGGHLGGAADGRHPVPAQPDPADPAPGGGRRRLRQGPAGAARLPPARRARGAPGGAGVPRDARPHQPPRRAAHHHAGRRQPRSAHRADPLQARAGPARATAPRSRRCSNDVNEMQHMLEDYLAFAKGDGGEEAAPTNICELLDEVQEETEHLGTPIEVRMRQPKRRAGAAAEAAGLQARGHQPRHQRRPLRRHAS